jgi:hypothetical protein
MSGGPAPLIHPATALRLGPAAVVIAKLAVAMSDRPGVERWIVYRTPGGDARRGHLRVEPASEEPIRGTVYGIYTRSVTLEQLVDDLGDLADEEAAAC